MASITSVGTGSGIDLEGLLKDMLTAEEAPVTTRLNARESKVQASISTLGSLKSSLSYFQTALAKLKDPSAFANRSVTSSNTAAFSATTTTTSGSAELCDYAI